MPLWPWILASLRKACMEHWYLTGKSHNHCQSDWQILGSSSFCNGPLVQYNELFHGEKKEYRFANWEYSRYLWRIPSKILWQRILGSKLTHIVKNYGKNCIQNYTLQVMACISIYTQVNLFSPITGSFKFFIIPICISKSSSYRQTKNSKYLFYMSEIQTVDLLSHCNEICSTELQIQDVWCI